MVNLKALYPELVVKGEESDESTAKVESAVKPEELTADVLDFIKTQKMMEKQKERLPFIADLHAKDIYTEDEIASAPFETFNTKGAVVWIDPLDGTSDYCRGNIGAVTVLIGLTINDKSRAGVVHMPFSALPDKSQGRTLFGTGEHGMYSVQYTADMQTKDMVARVAEYSAPYDKKMEADHEIRVAVSSNRPAPKEMMDSIAPSVGIGLGGCGNKCKALLLDEADAYITSGLSYWDVCACEPLVRARGGFITLGNGEKLSYPLGQHHVDGLNAS
jgi:3'(2'), 5'-bisphosphate nucleotidase